MRQAILVLVGIAVIILLAGCSESVSTSADRSAELDNAKRFIASLRDENAQLLKEMAKRAADAVARSREVGNDAQRALELTKENIRLQQQIADLKNDLRIARSREPIVLPATTETMQLEPSILAKAGTDKKIRGFVSSYCWDAQHSVLEISGEVLNIGDSFHGNYVFSIQASDENGKYLGGATSHIENFGSSQRRRFTTSITNIKYVPKPALTFELHDD